ncbi:hypothetical protein COMA1_11761 [Candidatus Nitrospira nitrosa]|uniref:Uncharacterized protein n=1 Tax=Candidatus Nitrospira nitrosa TaxID=1742972 RepID=A0A0S4LA23_9BACT|nr:hypothetical protein COMA1_11761 [Candidatus Nitrospira nitrosa]
MSQGYAVAGAELSELAVPPLFSGIKERGRFLTLHGLRLAQQQGRSGNLPSLEAPKATA